MLLLSPLRKVNVPVKALGLADTANNKEQVPDVLSFLSTGIWHLVYTHVHEP